MAESALPTRPDAQTSRMSEPEATHDYVDDQGELLFRSAASATATARRFGSAVQMATAAGSRI